MSKKTDLEASIREAGGSARRRVEPAVALASQTQQQPSRRGTCPITVHFPKEVRNQLKMLAIEQDTTMHRLIGEAFNDLFAKYNKTEAVP